MPFTECLYDFDAVHRDLMEIGPLGSRSLSPGCSIRKPLLPLPVRLHPRSSESTDAIARLALLGTGVQALKDVLFSCPQWHKLTAHEPCRKASLRLCAERQEQPPVRYYASP